MDQSATFERLDPVNNRADLRAMTPDARLAAALKVKAAADKEHVFAQIEVEKVANKAKRDEHGDCSKHRGHRDFREWIAGAATGAIFIVVFAGIGLGMWIHSDARFEADTCAHPNLQSYELK